MLWLLLVWWWRVGVLVVVGIAIQGIHALHLVFLALCRCCCQLYTRTTMALRQEDRCHTWTDRCMQVYGFSTLRKARRNLKKSIHNFSCVQMQLAHVRSRSYRNIPEITNTFQKLPKPSRSQLHIPEATETLQKLPTHSRSYRNIPEATEAFQKLPTHCRKCRSIPVTTEAFQKLPTHSRNYRNIPEATGA